MSLTIHCKYKNFDSTAQRAEDRRQKFHFCRLPFAVNVMLNLSNNEMYTPFLYKNIFFKNIEAEIYDISRKIKPKINSNHNIYATVRLSSV